MRVVSGRVAQARYWRRPGFAASSCPDAMEWPTGFPADARSHRRPYCPLPVRVLGAAFRLAAPREWIVDLLHGGISCCSLTGKAVATYGMDAGYAVRLLRSVGAEARSNRTRVIQVGGYRPQFRPHRISLESLRVLPVYAAAKSAQARDKVATLLSRQRAERSPMQPGSGEYQGLGQLTTGCRGAGCSNNRCQRF